MSNRIIKSSGEYRAVIEIDGKEGIYALFSNKEGMMGVSKELDKELADHVRVLKDHGLINLFIAKY